MHMSEAWYGEDNIFKIFSDHVEKLQSSSAFRKKHLCAENENKLKILLQINRITYIYDVICRKWDIVSKKKIQIFSFIM